MVLGSHQGQNQKSINHSSRDGLLEPVTPLPSQSYQVSLPLATR